MNLKRLLVPWWDEEKAKRKEKHTEAVAEGARMAVAEARIIIDSYSGADQAITQSRGMASNKGIRWQM